MPDKFKYFDLATPCDLAAKHLFNRHGLNVPTVALILSADNPFNLSEVIRRIFHWESATKSSTFHKREDTPRAIAGVLLLRLPCCFTKL